MTQQISRCVLPPDQGPHIPFIRRVRPAELVRGVVLTSDIFGCYTHYLLDAGKTFPCTADRDVYGKILSEENCPHCLRHHPFRWMGYLFFWNNAKNKSEFLEVTKLCWQTAVVHLVGGTSLRGYDLDARRGNGKKTRVTLTLSPASRPYDPMKLPPEQTPELALFHTMQD